LPATQPLVQAPGANANGTPGNQLLNESAFVITEPVQLDARTDSAAGVGQSIVVFGNAGAGSLIPIPGTRMLTLT